MYRVAAAGPSLRSRGSPSSMVKTERIAKENGMPNNRPVSGKEKEVILGSLGGRLEGRIRSIDGLL